MIRGSGWVGSVKNTVGASGVVGMLLHGKEPAEYV